MVSQSVSGLGEKMMRRSNKPERDLTRKGDSTFVDGAPGLFDLCRDRIGPRVLGKTRVVRVTPNC